MVGEISTKKVRNSQRVPMVGCRTLQESNSSISYIAALQVSFGIKGNLTLLWIIPEKRLILITFWKIREYLESQAPIDLDNVDQNGLDALVDIMVEDNKFQKQELARLESLLSNVGTKYCGEKIESLEQVKCHDYLQITKNADEQ